MPINICERGHLTGYRNCGTCGGETVRQMADHSERNPQRDTPRERGAEAVAFAQRRPPFKTWRFFQRQKAGWRREAAR